MKPTVGKAGPAYKMLRRIQRLTLQLQGHAYVDGAAVTAEFGLQAAFSVAARRSSITVSNPSTRNRDIDRRN